MKSTWIVVWATVCAILIALGCDPSEQHPAEIETGNRSDNLMRSDTNAARVDSASVLARAYPRAGFNFLYETGWGTKLDTFAGTMTKDLVDRPDTTIRLTLSKAELDRVHAKMIEIGFFAFREPHPPWPKEDENCSQDPHTTVRIEATSGETTRRLFWSTERCLFHRTPAWQGLAELEGLILDLMAQQPEWKRLPEPRAAYL